MYKRMLCIREWLINNLILSKWTFFLSKCKWMQINYKTLLSHKRVSCSSFSKHLFIKVIYKANSSAVIWNSKHLPQNTSGLNPLVSNSHGAFKKWLTWLHRIRPCGTIDFHFSHPAITSHAIRSFSASS